MEITGDVLIEVLGRPEWDEKVKQVLEVLGLGRVELSGEFFSEDFYIDKYALGLSFSYVTKTAKQYERKSKNDIYLNQVSFKKDCTIVLPFGLEKGDSCDTCIEKIKIHTQPLKYFRATPLISRLQLQDEEKEYFFVMKFTDDEKKGLSNIVMHPVDIEEDYSHLSQYEVTI